MTRGNDVMAACLTPVSVWGELWKKEDNNDDKDSSQIETFVSQQLFGLF